MRLTSEIYLTDKFVSKEEWLKLIDIVSNYNGIFKSWKMTITNNNNQIRYFINTRCNLPTTINNLNFFLLKQAKEIKTPPYNCTLLFLSKIEDNIIDIINYNEIKNKGNLKYLEITFLKVCEGKIKSKVRFYLYKNGVMKRYNVIFASASNILSVDFNGNKKYFYRDSPKYLEISKILNLLNSKSSNALLSVDTFPYLRGNFYLNLNDFSFDKHSIVTGSSGCGKSKFVSLLINNIYKNEIFKQKYKIVVIDPHAALENDIGGFGRVIDFKSDFDSIDLFINDRKDIILSTELLLDLLKSLIADQYNSKIERVLRFSIYLLLANESFNFKNLKKLILDLEYRNNLIKSLKDNLPISVIDFFLLDFNDLKTKSYDESVSPIISFIDEIEMIPTFNLEKNSENLKDVIQSNFLTLFSLDRTKLGEKVTKTISGLIMQQLLTLVQSRTIDKHIIFVIDEISIVENPILPRFLSEARKYNLSLMLIGQYFNQISVELKNSIFANAINYFIFRISKLDADLLVDNFDMKIPLDNSRERKIKLLTELNDRECIVRIGSNGVLLPAFKGVTLDYKSVPRIKRMTINEISGTNNNVDINKPKSNFSLNSNVSLKDILISNSSSRKVVKNE